jgi:hypothetical protein
MPKMLFRTQGRAEKEQKAIQYRVMSKEKIIKLAKKLKALAERGIDGEKSNAKDKLDALLKKYDLAEYQITDGLRTFERTTLNEGSVILERIIKSVNPEAQIMVKKIKTKLIIEVILTDIEYKEVRQKYRFFWRAYNRERKLLLSAFINKHWDYFTSNQNGYGSINKNSHPFQESQSFAVQKSEQQPSSQSSQYNQPSGSPNSDGFKGKQLTPVEQDKVRYLMKMLYPLDYTKIKEMQDADSPSDMEYKEPTNP